MKFVREMIPTSGLIEGLDYEIVSMLSECGDGEFVTLDEFLGVKSQTLFQELDFENDIYNKLGKHFEESGVSYSMCRTRQPMYANCDTFYLLNQDIDFSSAYTFGFGVVKIIRGEYEGLYMLYNFNKVQEEGFEDSDVIQELLALKMYLQFVNIHGYYDEGVESLVTQYERSAKALMMRSEDDVIKVFKQVFETNKENNV